MKQRWRKQQNHDQGGEARLETGNRVQDHSERTWDERTKTTIEEETTQGKQPPGRKTPEEQERKEAEPIQTEDTEQVHPGKSTPERRGKARRGDPGGPTDQLGRVGTLQQKL